MAKQKEQHEYTQEMIEELYKCSQNPLYFAEHYIYVIHPEKGRIKITLRDYQEEFIQMIQDNKKCINMQSRQTGKCCNYHTKVIIREKNTINKQEISMGELFEKI